jgi:hypothetical protein
MPESSSQRLLCPAVAACREKCDLPRVSLQPKSSRPPLALDRDTLRNRYRKDGQRYAPTTQRVQPTLSHKQGFSFHTVSSSALVRQYQEASTLPASPRGKCHALYHHDRHIGAQQQARRLTIAHLSATMGRRLINARSPGLIAKTCQEGNLAITLPPPLHQVIAILNRYLERMVDIITTYRGTVDEFQGDGILAFFGAPLAAADDCEQAVACAVAMQTAMVETNAEQRHRQLPELHMEIGMNTGQVVVGLQDTYACMLPEKMPETFLTLATPLPVVSFSITGKTVSDDAMAGVITRLAATGAEATLTEEVSLYSNVKLHFVAPAEPELSEAYVTSCERSAKALRLMAFLKAVASPAMRARPSVCAALR